MNLADYLTELLGQRNQVSVPGLGFFERVRVNGYYNEEESKFYPPHHQVKFSPEAKDDDSFAQYVADKKNISLASSKYFTEKFVSKLKEDAAAGNFPFSGLGSFQTEHGELVFIPNHKIINDPSLYGYQPVGIRKTNLPPPYEAGDSEPVVTEPVEIKPSDEEAIIQEHYIEEEEETRRSFNIWIGIMIFIVIAAIAVFGAYRYDPSIFDRFNNASKTPVKKPIAKKVALPVAGQNAQADSAKKTSAAADSSTKSATAFTQDTTTYDTLTQLHYVIRVDAFKRKKVADENVNHYKSLGLDAKLLPRAPRHLYKVIVGRYATRNSAELARLEMVKEKKIRRDSKTIKINPKK
jgi:flagellar basal body-associated protein FliL